MSSTLPRVTARLFGAPLMLHPDKLAAILAGLAPRLGLAPPMAPEPAAEALPPLRARGYGVTPEGVAVVPVVGGLVARAGQVDARSMPLRSYDAIASDLRQAMEDPAVRAVVLDVDSPGGEAAGAMELAAAIRAMRGRKPLLAVANHAAFSAAYALAAAAERVIVPPSGGVGSIGVLAAHLDVSRAEAEAGLRWTFVHAGARKLDGSPHLPLADEARQAIEAEVTRLYGMFVESVAVSRGLAPERVRATEAGLFFGAEAVAAGLADAVGTMDDALREASGASRGPVRGRSSARGGPREKRMDDASETAGMAAGGAPRSDEERQGVDVAALRAEAEAAVAARAAGIAALCELAGCPQRAAGFIREGRSEAEVRETLLAERAAAVDAAGELRVMRPAAAPDAPSPAAVKASWDRVGGALFGEKWKGF
ncbi:S49 family peptidase [Crenalkalicoccus roseus]|uniref:S49 family peptidase n=1 Tax=Crenalkalicoccus roseus TaxID=1485588 RepID=UPI00108021C3|nr:S49 family peptidase [Crenalkalicoccus roseus]